ncbi:hypothetical protein BELL_0792g00050 [Botrytis elliptica]|uniref:Zn(2)-C6 fungal-type domain-containing protein n=1 Tax=Botrytis elliptica TaxID=278938 RepID=A0A4Z1JIJ6_9HELO|nr:hypothetical protein BELL_0792g00050 [Botrytis elliptica]
MDSSGDVQLPDMNISGNLEFYRKIIDFENDNGKHELILGNLDRSQQRAVQSIAHSRNLDYECQQGCARVLRNCTTDWNIEAMIESSPAELTHYNESTDSGRLLNEPSHSEIDYFGSNLEIEPWPQYSVYPYPLELPSELAQDNVAAEDLPLPQLKTGSQLNMSEYGIYGNSSALNGNKVDCNKHVGEEVTLAANLGTPRISSDNSGYGPIQQHVQSQAYVCNTCQKSHSREIDLRRHEIIHAEGKHMKCSSCAEYFTRRDLLLQHRREAHAKTLLKSAELSRPSLEVPKPPSHDSSTWSDNYNMGASLTDEPFLTSPLYTPPNCSSSRNSRSNSFNSSASLSPFPPSVLNSLNSPLDRFEMQGVQRFASGSRSGSVSSLRSEHGRNRITQTSRNSSISRQSFLKSQTMDAAHDSLSRYASSGGSRRKRPLTSWARIGMKAIKMIGGACWRCRILGKKCTEENPCDSCPKRSKAGKTAWTQIGCKRGTLSEEMESIDLCPKSYSQPMSSGIDILCLRCQRHWCQSSNSHESRCPKCQIIDAKEIGPFTSDLKNDYVEEVARRRKKDIVSFTEGEDTITELSLAIDALRQNMSLENFGRPSRPLSLARTYFPNQASMPSLIALDQCTMAIVWEIVEDSSHLQSLPTFLNPPERPLDDLVILLRSASIYQAKLEPDPHRLIAQSLICLREALELKHAKALGALHEFSHRECRTFEELDLTDLVIDNIPFEKSSEDMLELMLDMGLPVPCAFNYQFDNGVFRGRAFANFVDNRQASQAIDALQNFELDGETLQVEFKNHIPRLGERGTSSNFCKDRNVDNLMSAIKRYIEQLSKVFFKKENLRGKTWWLSVFYSLVIQSLVRATMKAIIGDGGAEIPSNINQYLHLAVRLFIATSGAHDPLARSIPVLQGGRPKALAGCDSCKRRKLKCTRWKPSCEACQVFQCPCIYSGKSEIDDSKIEDYNVASLSVQQAKWQSYGLKDTGEYLQYLFQDDGQPITHEATVNDEPQTTHSKRYWGGTKPTSQLNQTMFQFDSLE